MAKIKYECHTKLSAQMCELYEKKTIDLDENNHIEPCTMHKGIVISLLIISILPFYLSIFCDLCILKLTKQITELKRNL